MEIETRKSNELNGLNAPQNTSQTNEDRPGFPSKIPRKPPNSSHILTPDEITKEILVRAEKKRQNFPDGVDVLVAMKSPSQLRFPYLDQNLPAPSPPKIAKVRDKNKVTLDASELLSILEDGAETHYVEKPKPKIPRFSRGPRDLKIDPELEKSLAMKQLMEFSKKRGRPKKEQETNNNNQETSSSSDKPKKKEIKKATNRELQKLLQDEGAVNMLYSVEKGETESKERLLSSKTRLKKVLKKKAQEVEEAILGSTSTKGVILRQRADKTRKASVDSQDSEQSTVNDFTFASPAEASKIIRRHSSSSSYSSRSSSPRRMSVDFEKSPNVFNSDNVHNKEETPTKTSIRMSERAEKLIEMKCKELNLQPEHSYLIKQLVQDKKNGLKERLQTEFATKFKAAVNSPLQTPTKPQTPSSSNKPAWKVVVEDWDSTEEGSDIDGDVKPLSSLQTNSTSKTEEQIATPNSRPEKPPSSKQLGPCSSKQIIPSSKATISNQSSIQDNQNSLLQIKKLSNLQSSSHHHFVKRPSTQSSHSKPAVFQVTQIPFPKQKEEIASPPKPSSSQINAVTTEKRVPDISACQSIKVERVAPIFQGFQGTFTGTEVRLEKSGSVARVNIMPTSCHFIQALNAKVLGELCQALDYLEQSTDTKVIILMSNAKPGIFLNGIDLPSLLSTDLECRKSLASQTALALKDFVCKLSMVGRPVLVGVSGQAVGLGVILLAYCDYILSDESSTFFTPYSRLGYLPEAAATLALPHVIGHRNTCSLLLGCSRLNSTEAEQCGLVSKVVPKSDLEGRLMEVAVSISHQSPQSMVSTKALLMHSIRTRLPNVLNMEVRLLEQHWSSEDCQDRIRSLETNPIF